MSQHQPENRDFEQFFRWPWRRRINRARCVHESASAATVERRNTVRQMAGGIPDVDWFDEQLYLVVYQRWLRARADLQ